MISILTLSVTSHLRNYSLIFLKKGLFYSLNVTQTLGLVSRSAFSSSVCLWWGGVPEEAVYVFMFFVVFPFVFCGFFPLLVNLLCENFSLSMFSMDFPSLHRLLSYSQAPYEGSELLHIQKFQIK